MRNKWEQFKGRSTMFIAVAVWMVIITTYNLLVVLAYHDFFSLVGLILGVLILVYMWLELDRKDKDYKRYYG